jgi:hypothetical protein
MVHSSRYSIGSDIVFQNAQLPDSILGFSLSHSLQ